MKRQKRPKAAPLLQPASKWKLKDRLQVWVVIAACIGGVAGYLWMMDAVQHQRDVDNRLLRWSREYELSPAEVDRIREIEIAFHGRTDLFSTGSPAPSDFHRHEEIIAGAMHATAAARFRQRSSGQPH